MPTPATNYVNASGNTMATVSVTAAFSNEGVAGMIITAACLLLSITSESGLVWQQRFPKTEVF